MSDTRRQRWPGLAVLHEIRDLIRAMLELQQVGTSDSPRTGRGLTAGDRQILRVVLPAINSAIGDAQFSVSDLIEYGDTDPELRAALDSVGLSNKRLGRLLQRSAGLTIGAHEVKRVRVSRAGAVWVIQRRP